MPAQTVEDITGGSTERSSGAKGVRNDFVEYKRTPRTKPGRDRTGHRRWSGRRRAPVTSSRRQWRRGTGGISLPLELSHRAQQSTNSSVTVLRGRNKDTLGNYMRQIKRLARTESMRPGDGPRAVLESMLLAIAQTDQSESSAKAVLSAAHLMEKMGWMPTVIRPSDWHLVMAIELQRSKEDRAAVKEWAQIDDLIRICEAARRALACLSVGPAAFGGGGSRGAGWGRHTIFRGKVQEGVAVAGAGALGARMATVPCQTHGAQRLPPRQGGVACR